MATTTKIASKLHQGMYQPAAGRPCWHTPADAAKALGVTAGTIVRAAKRAGAARVRGKSVAGMVELWRDGFAGYVGYMPFSSAANE